MVELVTGQFECFADHLLCIGVVLQFDETFSQKVVEEDADGRRVSEEGKSLSQVFTYSAIVMFILI